MAFLYAKAEKDLSCADSFPTYGLAWTNSIQFPPNITVKVGIICPSFVVVLLFITK